MHLASKLYHLLPHQIQQPECLICIPTLEVYLISAPSWALPTWQEAWPKASKKASWKSRSLDTNFQPNGTGDLPNGDYTASLWDDGQWIYQIGLLPVLQKNNTLTAGLFVPFPMSFPTTKLVPFLCLAKPHAVLALAKSNAFHTKITYSEDFVSFPGHRNRCQNRHFGFAPNTFPIWVSHQVCGSKFLRAVLQVHIACWN